MAITSAWVWQSINRNRDYSVINGEDFYRENWQAVRYRTSDAAYASELGEQTSDSGFGAGDVATLYGKNGGVVEGVAPPTYTTLNILDPATSVTFYFPSYEGYTFYRNAWTFGGIPTYSSPQSCIPTTNTDLTAARRPLILYDASYGYWAGVAETQAAIQTGEMEFATVAQYYNGGAEANSLLLFDWTSTTPGDPTLASNVVFSSADVKFRCTSDLQSYDQASVDWYKQTQTWIAKSPWG